MKLASLKILLFLSISMCSLNAQVDSEKKLMIEGFIGLNQYGLIESNPNASAGPPSTSLGFGLATNYYFNRTWSVRSGLYLFKKGGRSETNIFIDGFCCSRYGFTADFLSIPILGSWHFGKYKRWSLAFGPVFSFNVSNNDDLIYKNQDHGFGVELAYSLPLGPGYLIFSSKGLAGFNELQRYDGPRANVDVLANFNVKQRNGILSIGYGWKM